MCNVKPSLFLALLFSMQLSHATPLDLKLPDNSTLSTVQSDVLTIQVALDRVQLSNPSIAEMMARAEAMSAIPSQVSSLPDPMLTFNMLNLPVDTLNINQEAMTQLQFGISQQIPYPGKLALKEKIASFQVDAANSTVDELRLHLNRDVKTLWWRLFYLERSLEVIEINKTLLRQFISIAQTKYKVGQGLQQDVLFSQLELSKLIDRNIQLDGKKKQESARLNALLNQTTNKVINLPELNNINVELSPLKTASILFDLAKTNRPALAEQQLHIDAANARKELAERDLLPDFNIGAAYGFRQGDMPNGDSRSDLFSLKIGIKMPLFAESKQKMAISQRHSEVKQQQYALQDKWLSIQADMTSIIADYERAIQQVLLFKTGIVPQAQQTVASMLAG